MKKTLFMLLLFLTLYLSGCFFYPSSSIPPSSTPAYYIKPPYVLTLSSGKFSDKSYDSYCTGILIDPKHILSVNHCKGSKNVWIEYVIYPLQVIKEDHLLDLVLFEVKGRITSIAEFPTISAIDLGSYNAFWGNCTLQKIRYDTRVLMYITSVYGLYGGTPNLNVWNVVKRDGSINLLCPGDSGGGLFQRNEEETGLRLVGLLTSVIPDHEVESSGLFWGTQGFFVSYENIREFLDEDRD